MCPYYYRYRYFPTNIRQYFCCRLIFYGWYLLLVVLLLSTFYVRMIHPVEWLQKYYNSYTFIYRDVNTVYYYYYYYLIFIDDGGFL